MVWSGGVEDNQKWLGGAQRKNRFQGWVWQQGEVLDKQVMWRHCFEGFTFCPLFYNLLKRRLGEGCLGQWELEPKVC